MINFFKAPHSVGSVITAGPMMIEKITVNRVTDIKQADIVYQKYTRNYSNHATNHYEVVKTGRRYKKFASAVKAVEKLVAAS